MNSRPRVAVVGYGYWGPNLARNIALSDETELAAVCDVSRDALLRAAKHHAGVPLLEGHRAVLRDPSIDAIAIALPMALHHPVALEALEHGKHVLVEKPLASSVAECDELIAAADERGLTILAGHTFLFNEAVRTVKRYLDAGELGDPYYVSMRRTNLGIVRSDANVMWNLAPHDISILRYWLDRDVVSVRATGVAHLQEGIEDVVYLSIEFEGGVLGHVHASWLEPNKIREATVVGSRKMAVYDDTAEAKIRLYDKGIDRRTIERGDREDAELGRYEDFATFQMIARAGDILLPKIDFREPLAREIAHFAACIAGEEEPIAGGREAREVVAILEAAQRSLGNGGAPEPLSRPIEAAGRV